MNHRRLVVPLLVLAAGGACTPRPATTSGSPPPHLAAATQLLLVITPDWDSTSGVLRRFVRDAAPGAWRAEGGTVPVVIGRKGLAWGVGFDELAAPGEPRKHEGDGRSPAGAITLDTAFGFAPADSVAWLRLPYLPLTTGTDCVDDTTSLHYNTVVDRSAVPAPDWQSAEHMRQIQQYRLGVITGYNTAPHVPGRGSCIFLHIWAGPGSTTSGCTAADADHLAGILAWLDPRARPVLVQLPAGAYARLQHAWQLPADGEGR